MGPPHRLPRGRRCPAASHSTARGTKPSARARNRREQTSTLTGEQPEVSGRLRHREAALGAAGQVRQPVTSTRGRADGKSRTPLHGAPARRATITSIPASEAPGSVTDQALLTAPTAYHFGAASPAGTETPPPPSGAPSNSSKNPFARGDRGRTRSVTGPALMALEAHQDRLGSWQPRAGDAPTHPPTPCSRGCEGA